jgi:hypothetical protein
MNLLLEQCACGTHWRPHSILTIAQSIAPPTQPYLDVQEQPPEEEAKAGMVVCDKCAFAFGLFPLSGFWCHSI